MCERLVRFWTGGCGRGRFREGVARVHDCNSVGEGASAACACRARAARAKRHPTFGMAAHEATPVPRWMHAAPRAEAGRGPVPAAVAPPMRAVAFILPVSRRGRRMETRR